LLGKHIGGKTSSIATYLWKINVEENFISKVFSMGFRNDSGNEKLQGQQENFVRENMRTTFQTFIRSHTKMFWANFLQRT